MWVDGCHVPVALSPGKTRYPLHRRLGWPQGQSGRVQKISRPLVFDPRIAQLIASRCTVYAIPAPILYGKYLVLVGTMADTTLHSEGTGAVVTCGTTAARWTNTGSISDRTKRVSSSSQRPRVDLARLVSQVTFVWAYLIGEEAVKVLISLNLPCIGGVTLNCVLQRVRRRFFFPKAGIR